MSMLEKQSMQYRNLGNSGLRVSRLGIAMGPGLAMGMRPTNTTLNPSQTPTSNVGTPTLNLTEELAEQMLNTAYEAGVNFFDASDGQGGTGTGRTEILLGKILKKKKWRRSSYLVATRIIRTGPAETERGLSRKHVVEALQASLERMGLVYVDVVFACGRDRATPIEEIVRAFSWIIDKGWAFYWGTAGWSQAEIMEAYTVAKLLNLTPPLVDQCEYNMFRREPIELVIPELLCGIGCGCITSSPLAGGIINNDTDININDIILSSNESIPLAMQLTPRCNWTIIEREGTAGERERTYSERDRTYSELTSNMHKMKLLRPVADQLGCSMTQLAIAWCLRTDLVQGVLVSPTSLDQLRDHLLAISVVDKLTPESLAIIEKILGNQPCVGGGTAKNKSSGKNAHGQSTRRRSVGTSAHRKSISSSPRLSISHNNPYEGGGRGMRESVDYSYERRMSHF